MKNTQKQGHFSKMQYTTAWSENLSEFHFHTISKCNADIATRIADILTAQIHLLWDFAFNISYHQISSANILFAIMGNYVLFLTEKF